MIDEPDFLDELEAERAARASQDEPEAVPLPRPRPPRSHRDAESLRRWEARHPSVRFRPTVPLEQECVHVWRSSFGDTFCEKCNQDAPSGVRCRTCMGSGTWSDEGWVNPPQPCKACSGLGRAPEPPHKWGFVVVGEGCESAGTVETPRDPEGPRVVLSLDAARRPRGRTPV